MTYAELKERLVTAGQQHLVAKMEEAVAEEAKTLVVHCAGLAGHAYAAAESTMALHVTGFLSGEYGELTPDAVFSHRAILVRAWAVAGCIADAAAGGFYGNPPRPLRKAGEK